jgi:hypothetical protein
LHICRIKDDDFARSEASDPRTKSVGLYAKYHVHGFVGLDVRDITGHNKESKDFIAG